MKTGSSLSLVAISINLLLTAFTASANQYITESLSVPYFAQIGDQKALGKLQAGSPVKVLKQQGQWSQISTPNQQTGWIQSDFISNTMSRLERIQSQQTSLQKLQARVNTKQAEINFLNQQLEQLRQAAINTNRETIELNAQLRRLQSSTAKQLQQQVGQLQQQLEFRKIDQQISSQALRHLAKEDQATWRSLLLLGVLISFLLGFLIRAWLSRKYHQF